MVSPAPSQPVIINLFGGPGVGKSTTAAEIYARLSRDRHLSEMIPEFAKVLTWADHQVALRDQLYVFSKQDHRLEVLRDQPIEFVVSDSPLLFSLIYKPDSYYQAFDGLVLEVFKSYRNLNVFLERGTEYVPHGRSQDEEEARELDGRIKESLLRYEIPFITVSLSDAVERTVHVAKQMRAEGALCVSELRGSPDPLGARPRFR